jgi:effector-binding domain-containing protein/uncharacterized protein YndB with AHSA1/START domain
MKALKIVGIVLLFILALILIVPLFLPGSFYVTRTNEVNKPIEQVFKAATDYTLRAKWDPWLEQEPEAEVRVGNVPEMIGSWYEWKGEVIGSGRMEILEVEIPNKIVASLHFIEPFDSKSTVIWEFENVEGKTKVTWGFEGTAAYPIERIFMVNIDGQIGPDFERGLANFKKMVEEMKTFVATTSEVEEVKTDAMNAVLIMSESNMEEMKNIMATNYGKLMAYIGENQLKMVGAPFTLYHSWDSLGNTNYESGIPIAKAANAGNDEIVYREIESFKAVKAIHYGPYDQLMVSYEKMMGYMSEKGLEMNGATLEIYMTDPQQEPDMSKWETQIFIPYK